VAVDGIDLDVAQGEVVALLGPNGAGKSTTIDMLLGLTPPPPDAGTVRLWGLSPKQAGAAGHVGAVLQGGGLLGGVTVRELVELMRGLAPSPLPTSEVLAMARITEVADARADRLSGGQTQRVRFGHSLTTVVVKAELAERLVSRDPDRAAAERAQEKVAKDTIGRTAAKTMSGDMPTGTQRFARGLCPNIPSGSGPR